MNGERILTFWRSRKRFCARRFFSCTALSRSWGVRVIRGFRLRPFSSSFDSDPSALNSSCPMGCCCSIACESLEFLCWSRATEVRLWHKRLQSIFVVARTHASYWRGLTDLSAFWISQSDQPFRKLWRIGKMATSVPESVFRYQYSHIY